MTKERYRIKIINLKTGDASLLWHGFTSRKKAKEWAVKWKSQGFPFECEIIDTKTA